MDVAGASGGTAVVFMLGPFLICLGFVIVNLVWAAVSLISGLRRRPWSRVILPVLMLAGWSAAWIFDSTHHGG